MAFSIPGVLPQTDRAPGAGPSRPPTEAEEIETVAGTSLFPAQGEVRLQQGETVTTPQAVATLAKVQRQDPQRFVGIQTKLALAGRLSAGDYNDEVGQLGPKTRAAYTDVLEELVALTPADDTLTVGRYLDEIAEIGEIAGAGAGADRTVVLSDPAGIRQNLRSTAEQLGIDTDSITPEVEAAVIATLHGQQRAAQSGAAEIVQVDPSAQIVSELEARFGAQIERAEAVEETQIGTQLFDRAASAIAGMIGG